MGFLDRCYHLQKNVCFVTMLFLIEPMLAQVQESIKEHFEKLDIAISLVEQSLKKEDTISILPLQPDLGEASISSQS